jgi:trehalose 6-phosphate phosphatase
MSPDAVAHNAGDWALFLDVDGTLLEIAETPYGVHVPESLKELLVSLSFRLDGALALVSGRTIENVDRLFDPLRFAVAGIHGCELRQTSGCVLRPALDTARLDRARVQLVEFAAHHPGLLLEDKGYGLAVHFRRVPHLSGDVDHAVRQACRGLGGDFTVQAGKCVFEIRPAHCTKGSSITSFMREPAFAGRMPIFIGDDATDESGFAVVNELGGISIKVGDGLRSLARHRLLGVRQVIRWLESIPLPSFERPS